MDQEILCSPDSSILLHSAWLPFEFICFVFVSVVFQTNGSETQTGPVRWL